MKSCIRILICAIFLGAPLRVSAVIINWSPVGNPGNTADTIVLPANNSTVSVGAVAHAYNIGTYDVTCSQYVEFLNSNEPTGPSSLQLYLPAMDVVFTQFAAFGHHYSVAPNGGDLPISHVTFYNAARFTNWLENGQVAGMTETGTYTLLGFTPIPSNAATIARNPAASVFLPNNDEWFKAAFYNASTGLYFLYPTSSDVLPTASPPTATPNSANYDPTNGGPNAKTPVGAYSGSASPYGAFDMAGNVSQWLEDYQGIGALNEQRTLRGSSYSDFVFLNGINISNVWQSPFPAQLEGNTIGFRVASVPEPGASVLAVIAFGMLGVLRKKVRRV